MFRSYADATRVSGLESCHSLFGSSRRAAGLASLVTASGLAHLASEAVGFRELCDSTFLAGSGEVLASDVAALEKLRGVCTEVAPGSAYPRRLGEISGGDKNQLAAFADISYPCVVRSSAPSGRNWSAASLAADFAGERVNTLVFDGGVQGSDISAAEMDFGEFVSAAVGGFDVERGGEGLVDPVLYLLLTTRGLAGETGNVAMDPNPGSALLALLDEVGFGGGLKEGLEEAWSNLR